MRKFWLLHAVLPAALFALLVAVIIAAHLDLRTADAVFFDWKAGRWIGAGSWWAADLIHIGGRNFVVLVALCALLAVAASFARESLRRLRRGATFIVLGILLSTGVVGLLKSVTNVDCPWDLQRYGGTRPYITLFADRPDQLPHARCFPGAHSSSGFALMCFYFLLRDTRRHAARMALAGGLLAGLVFSLGQQARGAHFLSHDLTSAVLVWYVLLGTYVWLLKPRAARAIDSAPRRVQPH